MKRKKIAGILRYFAEEGIFNNFYKMCIISGYDVIYIQIPFFFFFFFFLGLYLQHMGTSRLGVESELQLPAFATATAMWDWSCVCDLYHSSWQCQILNPLSEARDQTHILMDASQVCQPLSHDGNSNTIFLNCGITEFPIE